VDPQYGIASLDEDGNITAQVYLYRDGSLYWKLNLVEPYFTVEKINRPLPKPPEPSDAGAGGDLVDWTLALIVMSMILVGIVMIIQQMNTKILHRLYHLQRWFFNPTEHDYEGDMLVPDSNELGEDGVPISMGGRRTLATNRYLDLLPSKGNSLGPASSNSPGDFDDENDVAASTGDVEMRDLSWVSGEDSFDMRSRSSNEESDDIAARILAKNPDMVDLPSLSSTSKVATPVGMQNESRKVNDLLDS